MWKDRFFKMREVGFNMVDIYVVWNWYEFEKGSFDFKGEIYL